MPRQSCLRRRYRLSALSRQKELMRTALCLAVAVLLAALPSPGRCEADQGDVVFQRKASSSEDIPAATFPHWVHRMQYTCYACHDAPFKMKAGANAITMEDIS